ncbi:MAG: thiamine pyrophosphate-dependent enzyme [bacterium]
MYNSSLSKFCPGCGYPIALMTLGKTLENSGFLDKAVLGLDIGCSLLAINSLPINTFQTHHGRVTPTMAGFKKARPNSICLGFTGDGGAYAIGLQNLLYSAKRDEPITIIVMNNTLYAMTGGQTAPTTLAGQITSTDPKGNDQEPLLGPEFLSQIISKKAFLARSAVNDPKGLGEFLTKAIETQQSGHFSLVEILSSCPTNWRTKGIETIDRLNALKETFKLGIISRKTQ